MYSEVPGIENYWFWCKTGYADKLLKNSVVLDVIYSVLRTMLHPSVNRNAKVLDYYIGISITTDAVAYPSAGCY